MKKGIFFTFCLFAALWSQSQGVGINETGADPHPSAVLDASSSSKGFLAPRLTSAQRDAIQNPEIGLQIFNVSTNCLNYWDGMAWFEICGNCIPGPPAQPLAISGETALCEGSTRTYSIAEVSGASAYSWIVPDGSVITQGQGTSSVEVELGSLSGAIVVTAYNACGFGQQQVLNIAIANGPQATGGLITTTTEHRIHTFTTSGSFIPNACLAAVDVLLVGGGGGGTTRHGGGGGGGGVIEVFGTQVMPLQEYPVIVGEGGAGLPSSSLPWSGPLAAASGGNSSFQTWSAWGGGGGGREEGLPGGSGGGCGVGTTDVGVGTPGQGYNGGFGTQPPLGTECTYSGGGGGGADGPGGNGSTSNGGQGGAGKQSTMSGSPVNYGGGGGGGTCGSGNGGNGGIGGGGKGGGANGTAQNGGANMGGGGGAGGFTSGNNFPGGAGGSGVVIIRYLLTNP